MLLPENPKSFQSGGKSVHPDILHIPTLVRSDIDYSPPALTANHILRVVFPCCNAPTGRIAVPEPNSQNIGIDRQISIRKL
jgi:hypothetical protein